MTYEKESSLLPLLLLLVIKCFVVIALLEKGGKEKGLLSLSGFLNSITTAPFGKRSLEGREEKRRSKSFN